MVTAKLQENIHMETDLFQKKITFVAQSSKKAHIFGNGFISKESFICCPRLLKKKRDEDTKTADKIFYSILINVTDNWN